MTSLPGALYAAVSMVIVGGSAAVLAAITQYPTFGGQALRYGGAALILLAIQRARRLPYLQLTRREIGRLTLLAATGLAGFNVCFLEAVRRADPASVGTIIGGVPVALAVLDPLLAGRRPSLRLVVAAVVVTTGLGISQSFGGGSLPGLFFALGALAAEVAFSLLAVPMLPRLGPLRVSTYAAALAGPLLVGAGLLADGRAVLRLPTASEFAALTYLATVVTALGFVFWYAAIGRLGADRAGLFAGLAPMSAAASAAVLGTGHPTAADVAGALLVGLGVVLGLLPIRRAKRPTLTGADSAVPDP
jgi:drug/metabolite transporter (DMT)-like permease